MKIYTILLYMTMCLALVTSESIAQWVQTNGPEGAIVNCFAVDQYCILAGTEGGGAFRSTDNGITWSRMTRERVKVLGTNGSVYLVTILTGQTYCSTDLGNTWTDVSGTTSNLKSNVTACAFSSSNIFVGTGMQGVLRSTDNGANWTEVNSGIPEDWGMYPQIGPMASKPPYVYASIGSKLFFTDNEGLTWEETNFYGPQITALVATDTFLFAGTTSGLFYSTDNGSSWNEFITGLVFPDIRSLAVNGSNLFISLIADEGIYRSTDFGVSWSYANTGLSRTNVRCLAASGSMIFAGLDYGYGIWRSTDSGDNWHKASSGVLNTLVTGLCAIGSNLFASTMYNGVFSTTDGGSNWIDISAGLPELEVDAIIASGSNLLVGLALYGVYRSTDLGLSWSEANNGLTERFLSCFAVNGPRIYAGAISSIAGTGGGIFLSTDNGDNWSAISTDLANKDIRCMIVKGDTILVGTQYAGGGLFRSTDNGGSWANVGPGLSAITALAVSGSSIFEGSLTHGVHCSTDNGTTWSEIFSGLIMPADVVAFGVVDSGVVASTLSYDVYFLKNGNNSWTKVGTGMREVATAFLNHNGTLFAGTRGASVWQRLIAEITSINMLSLTAPRQFSLSQNYPNPFNPETVIRFRSSVTSNICVKVFDILGREVVTLLNGKQSAGEHTIRWNGNNSTGERVSSGVYYYQLTSEKGFKETKKMILLR